MRVESARAAAKPPTPSGDTVASEPPATMTSTSPCSIMRPAMPIECKPVVHAVTIARFGPWKPNMIETCPEIMLMIEAGTKKGVIRRGPRLSSSALVSSMRGKPPIPDPIRQPMRWASSWLSLSLVGRPASRIAWIDAARP